MKSSFRGRRSSKVDSSTKHVPSPLDVAGRVPPHNKEAEAAVLSTVLTDGQRLPEVLDVLPDGEAFYGDAHRRIYDAAVELHAKGQPVDIQTVAEVLRMRERLQAVGGVAYLAQIVDATPSVAHVAAHAKIVREKFRVRLLINQCMLTAAEAYGDYGTAQEFIDGHEQKVFALATEREQREYADAPTLMREASEIVRRAHEGTGGITGAPTGISSVDERTGGMHDGELIVVAARPGMGKTAWMMSVAMYLAEQPAFGDFEGYIVAVFSLEMPREQLGMRMVGASSGLGVARARTGKLGDDYGVWMQHTEKVARISIVIDDTPGISLLEVRAKCRRIQREHPKRKLVMMLDYVQLMGEPEGCGSREEAVAQNSRGLKGLAKEMRMPAMALSQINRKVEERTDKRPQMSDLRESGAIEQDADVIQFIFRPEYHLKPHEVPDPVKGLAEIITAKQRNGPPGTDYAAYRATATRFDDPTDADLQRWDMFDDIAQQQSIAKRFAPNSKLPGARTN